MGFQLSVFPYALRQCQRRVAHIFSVEIPWRDTKQVRKPYVWRSYLDYCIGGILVYPKLLLINSSAISSVLGIIHATTWKTQFDLVINEENKTNQVVV